MQRFQISPIIQGYEIIDLKYGQGLLATFKDFEKALQYVAFLNKKEDLIELIYKQVNDDLEESFKNG